MRVTLSDLLSYNDTSTRTKIIDILTFQRITLLLLYLHIIHKLYTICFMPSSMDITDKAMFLLLVLVFKYPIFLVVCDRRIKWRHVILELSISGGICWDTKVGVILITTWISFKFVYIYIYKQCHIMRGIVSWVIFSLAIINAQQILCNCIWNHRFLPPPTSTLGGTARWLQLQPS